MTTDRTIRPSDPSSLPLWQKERDGLYSALILLGQSSKARKHLNCGNDFFRYHCHECAKDIDIPQSCDLRLCPRCSIRRAYRFILTHQDVLDQMAQPKLLTLTFQSPSKLSKPLVKAYFKHFAALRRRKLWKDAVDGGIASLEFTYTPSGWHPHIHALIDSSYIPQRLLSTLWKRITKGSYIVYIQKTDQTKGVYEVAKYIAKGPHFYAAPHLVWQYMTATHRSRFFTTFGSFYGTAQPVPSPYAQPAIQDTSNLVNPPDPWIPLITVCPYCQGTALTFKGDLRHHQIQPPNVQIPF